MGYVAVKGGTLAIEESIKRLKYERLKKEKVVDVDTVNSSMRGLIDAVMSEASIYSEELASIAIKQAEGNIEEAVFLIRAYRSTLPRKHYSKVVEPNEMKIERRISASFKDILGGQILGATYDYVHRLLDFSLLNETNEEAKNWIGNFDDATKELSSDVDLTKVPKVVEYLRKEGIIKKYPKNNEEPVDITTENMDFPTERSERLQCLTRGQAGAVTSLAYSALRGCGIEHPTVGELRVGSLPIYVENPIEKSGKSQDDYYIGDIKVTEVECFIPDSVKLSDGSSKKVFELGYGICYGQNETKAIAMSILDQCLEKADRRFPTGNEEFVLLNIDSVESSGFISHLKLPHYVTFQSALDSVRKTQKGEEDHED